MRDYGETDRSSHTVFRTPVQCIEIDEVGCRESGQPGTCKADRSRKSESVGSKTLRGDLSACKPSIGGYHSVIAADVDDRHGDDDLFQFSYTLECNLGESHTFPVRIVPGDT